MSKHDPTVRELQKVEDRLAIGGRVTGGAFLLNIVGWGVGFYEWRVAASLLLVSGISFGVNFAAMVTTKQEIEKLKRRRADDA